jgi:hypothetical protein
MSSELPREGWTWLIYQLTKETVLGYWEVTAIPVSDKSLKQLKAGPIEVNGYQGG